MASTYRRRQFLHLTGVATAGAWLAACGGDDEAPRTSSETAATVASTRGAQAATPEALEKTAVSIGFIPITCIAPLVMAEPLGFYKKWGLDVTLKKYPGPAPLRDAFASGEVDTSHLLLPMPMALALGLGSPKVAARVAVSQNLNGQAITLANKHRGNVHEPQDFRGKVIGVPFDFSMHNLLLRHYLAQGGVDPDTDVQIRLVRAPDMVASLISGTIDGFLGPDPFNQRAVHEKAGFIFMLSRELWDGHPCCAFAVTEEFRMQYPATYRALVRALVDAATWSQDPAHREQIAEAIAPEEYLNQPPAVVKAVLTGQYDTGTGETRTEPNRIGFNPYPWRSWGIWMGTQLTRWGYAPGSTFATAADYRRVAEEGFLTPDARTAMQALNLDAPAADAKPETILGKTFNPDNPVPWTQKVVA
jgi:nitrate/nitrite transport system substrate-binding protein